MHCRDMAPEDASAVVALVMRGFDELVRPDFSEEGVAEFVRTVRSIVLDRAPDHRTTVAERDGRIVGMIDVRGSSHISLFFVEADERGRGVGRELLGCAVGPGADGTPPPSAITVNSSLWAVPVYERLGFAVTSPEVERHGIRAVPMARLL